MKSCRFCGKTGMHEVIDLGHQPPSNSFLTKAQLLEPEVTYPLKLFVCDSCWLVQIDEYKHADEIFKEDYIYYSSQSPSNVSHAKEFVEIMCERFNLARGNRIIEIGSNDGYLLKHFLNKGFAFNQVLGIEPSEGPRAEAMRDGVYTSDNFFNSNTAKGWKPADLICGINVLAHQPDINDFVKGLKIALAPNGVVVMEFPHLMNLIGDCQFDTIYHEHYSYFSFGAVCEIFARHDLTVFDVDEIPEHGGSLRIYAKHAPSPEFICCKLTPSSTDNVLALLRKEQERGMFSIRYYEQFQGRVDRIKHQLVGYLTDLYRGETGIKVCAYGAAAKGNTLLNYCGIKPDLVPYVVDRSPHKQGKYLPGSHIPVRDEAFMKEARPDLVLILPWNLKHEIMKQLEYIRSWDGMFLIPLPKLEWLS